MTEIGYIMAIQWGYTAHSSARQNAAKRDFALKSDSFHGMGRAWFSLLQRLIHGSSKPTPHNQHLSAIIKAWNRNTPRHVKCFYTAGRAATCATMPPSCL